jgi:hypothetical protein
MDKGFGGLEKEDAAALFSLFFKAGTVIRVGVLFLFNPGA